MASLKIHSIALGVVCALGASAATASTIKIDSIAGTWHSIVADNEDKADNPYKPGNAADETYLPSAGEGSNRVEWGWTWKAGPSAYDFQPSITPVEIDDPLGGSEVRVIGTFTHENRPIIVGGPVLRSADLELRVEGSINGESFVFTPTFSFDHNETANNGDDGGNCEVGARPCADIVTIGNVVNANSVIEAGGYSYRMFLDGFVDEVGGLGRSQFVTAENADNSTLVQWRISRDPVSSVPLPAAAWMLLAGLGGLAVAGRRKRA